jgi:dihydroorotase
VGNYADLVIVSESDHKVTDTDVVSKCGWTPLNGLTLHHRIDRVFVNGKTAYDNGIFANANAMPLQFSRQH